MFTKEELRHLWPFYFYSFMRGVVFLTTITLFVFLTEKGLSYAQGATLVAISQLAQVVSEIVTGSFADTFGRKKSVILSLLIDSGIILCISFVQSYSLLLFLFALWGVSATLASGADSAWAIDSLSRKKHLLDKYFVKSRSFFKLGSLVAGGLSALLLFYFDNQMLWWVRTGLTAMMAIVLLKAPEVFVSRQESTLVTAKKALRYFKRSRVLFLLSGALFFTYMATYIAESAPLQDFKLQAGIPLEWWGILFIISTFFGLFVPYVGMKLSLRCATNKYLAIGYGGMGVLYVMALVSMNLWYVAILTVLFVVFEDFYNPVEEKFYNAHVPSSLRASVNSIKAMISRFGVMVGVLIAGGLVDVVGGAQTIAIASVFIIPAIVLMFLLNKNDEKVPVKQ